MIELIKIKNFQSHKFTRIRFSPGLNAIIGDTDSGKSSVLRALKLVLFNKPGGDSYRSWWGGDTEITISTNDYYITRFRNNEGNGYKLKKGDDCIAFKAIGTEVPKEVQEVLNVDSINYQNQISEIFLLSETPGAVASYFNKIAKLDKIDSSVAYCSKSIREINSELKFIEKDLEEKSKKLEDFENLRGFEKALSYLKDYVSQYETTLQNKNDINRLKSKIEEIQKLISDYLPILDEEPLVDDILNMFQEKKEINQKLEVLKKVAVSYFTTRKTIKTLEKEILKETLIDNLLNLQIKQQNHVKKSTNLEKLYNTITFNLTQQKTTIKLIFDLEKDFNDNFPEICPLCGNIKK